MNQVLDNLHIQDEKTPKLTLCGRWSRAVTLLGDDFDTDERSVCLGCTRRALALKAHASIMATGEPRPCPICDSTEHSPYSCDCGQ